MAVPLKNYLEAFNYVAAAVLTNAISDEDKRKSLSLIAQVGTERVQKLNLAIDKYRESCVLSPAEKAAMSAEGCAIHLHPKKPAKRKLFG